MINQHEKQYEKPQLDDTSFPPQRGRSDTMTRGVDGIQELDVSSTEQMRVFSKDLAELRAGPYSNRHELESRLG